MKFIPKQKCCDISKVPKIGEVWKHKNDEDLYLRISDEDGLRIHPSCNKHFFSVRIIGTCTGTICYSKLDSLEKIEILNVELREV